MIFPVVLSFDKEIAFGYCIHIKRRRRGNNGGGKKSIFPLVGYTRRYIFIYINIYDFRVIYFYVRRWSYHTATPRIIL